MPFIKLRSLYEDTSTVQSQHFAGLLPPLWELCWSTTQNEIPPDQTQSPVFMKNGTYENFIWCSNLNRNTWENLKSVETVKKPYLESPSVLFLLLLRVYHLGQQGQDLLYSPSCPAVPVSLHGQDHTSDAAVDIMPSEQQQ